jgi:hypothetical protein
MTMIPIEEQFAEADHSWDLERLYTDLGKAKGRVLSPTEKLYLRGILCGYSPAEIAKKCNKSAGGVKVYLSSTVYQYVKILVSKKKLGNWNKIRKWLEIAGYKTLSTIQNITINEAEIINIDIKENINTQVTIMDINLRLAIPSISDSSKKD